MTAISRRMALVAGLAAAVPAVAAEPVKAPLWRLQRGGSTVWFFGSTPVDKDTAWMTPPVLRKFDESRELWVENPDFDPASAGAAIRQRVSEGGPTLAQVLPPHDL